MSRGWKIIGTMVLVLFLLGAISIGVGFMTGGDIEGIYATLNLRYNLTGYWEQYSQWAMDTGTRLVQWVASLF